MRRLVPPVLTAAGVLAVLGCLGSAAKAVEVWRRPESHCIFDHRPGAEGFCMATVPVTGLEKVPWAYLGLSVGLFLLAACIFAVREEIHPEG